MADVEFNLVYSTMPAIIYDHSKQDCALFSGKHYLNHKTGFFHAVL
jgi:hypothetical protein